MNLNKADSAAIRTSGSLSELVIADGWTRGTAQLDELCDRAIFFNTLQFIFKKLCDHEDFFFVHVCCCFSRFALAKQAKFTGPHICLELVLQ